MTPDKLRALADALEPMARAPRFEDFDVPAFCAWLRAQAEAEPVAWIVEHGPTRRLTFFDEAPGKVGTGVSIPLYTHPAPAAPQAEPCIGNDPICPCQDGDACHYKDAADGTKAWPVPQAGPKREPLTYEQLVSACYTYRHDFGLLDPDEQELVIEEAGRWAKAFGIGGSDAE